MVFLFFVSLLLRQVTWRPKACLYVHVFSQLFGGFKNHQPLSYNSSRTMLLRDDDRLRYMMLLSPEYTNCSYNNSSIYYGKYYEINCVLARRRTSEYAIFFFFFHNNLFSLLCIYTSYNNYNIFYIIFYL